MVAMASSAKNLRAFLDASAAVAFVEVADAKGSTPREKGAWMLVSPDAIYGTIGGGQLEYMAIDEARAVLRVAPAVRAFARRRGEGAEPTFAAPANDAVAAHSPLSASGTSHKGDESSTSRSAPRSANAAAAASRSRSRWSTRQGARPC